MNTKNPSSAFPATVRFIPEVYDGIQGIVPHLKTFDRQWSFGKLVNVAIMDFLTRFPQMTQRDLTRLANDYEALRTAFDKRAS